MGSIQVCDSERIQMFGRSSLNVSSDQHQQDIPLATGMELQKHLYGLFLVSHFLNTVERVERRNMFWHFEKRALMVENN